MTLLIAADLMVWLDMQHVLSPGVPMCLWGLALHSMPDLTQTGMATSMRRRRLRPLLVP